MYSRLSSLESYFSITAYQWKSPYTLNVLMPGLETIPSCHSTNWPPSPPPSVPSPSSPVHLSPSRLGDSVHLSCSSNSLQTGFPLRRYEGPRELSPCRDGCPSHSSSPEGGVRPSCYHYSHGTDRRKQSGQFGDRAVLGFRHSHGEAHSPLTVERYEPY